MKSVAQYRTQCWKDIAAVITPDIVLMAMYSFVQTRAERKQRMVFAGYARIFYPIQVLNDLSFPDSTVKPALPWIGRRRVFYECGKKMLASTKNKQILHKKLKQLYCDEATAGCPHLVAVIGPDMLGRLLRAAGGLRNLAFMTSRDVLNLGARRALFLHLAGKRGPPQKGFVQKKDASAVMKASRKDYFISKDLKDVDGS